MSSPFKATSRRQSLRRSKLSYSRGKRQQSKTNKQQTQKRTHTISWVASTGIKETKLHSKQPRSTSKEPSRSIQNTPSLTLDLRIPTLSLDNGVLEML